MEKPQAAQDGWQRLERVRERRIGRMRAQSTKTPAGPGRWGGSLWRLGVGLIVAVAVIGAAGCGSSDEGGADAVDVSSAEATAPASDARLRIGAFYHHACVVHDGDSASCWGDPLGDSADDGPRAGQAELVSELGAVESIAAGSPDCAIHTDRTVSCWGDFSFDDLEQDSRDARSPIRIAGWSDIQAVAASSDSACAVQRDGQVTCIGDGNYGNLGTGSEMTSVSPVAVIGVDDAVAIAGSGPYCATRSSGEIACWGPVHNDGDGSLGNGSDAIAYTPAPVSNVVDADGPIAGADGRFCALRGGGNVVCWGGGVAYPTEVIGVSGASDVAVGYRHACALLSSGAVTCWGDNDRGQLGIGTDIASQTPQQVSGIANAVAVSVGSQHSCALLADESAVCWGANDRGALGHGSGEAQSTLPAPVVGL